MSLVRYCAFRNSENVNNRIGADLTLVQFNFVKSGGAIRIIGFDFVLRKQKTRNHAKHDG